MNTQTMMATDIGPIMQLGYIVEDVTRTAAEWAQRAGAGPFYVIDRLPMNQYFFRGTRLDIELSLAFGYWGDIQVELVCPLDHADSLYRRALRDAPGRLNHCATVVPNVDRVLRDRNLASQVIHSGTMPTGLKFVYLDDYLPDGSHLELIESEPRMLAAFAGMRDLSRRWNGVDSVRPMSRLQADLMDHARTC